jgi:hypothetical protein
MLLCTILLYCHAVTILLRSLIVQDPAITACSDVHTHTRINHTLELISVRISSSVHTGAVLAILVVAAAPLLLLTLAALQLANTPCVTLYTVYSIIYDRLRAHSRSRGVL